MDKAALFAPRLPEADVEVPGVGTVRVRGLNRSEAMDVGKIADLSLRDRTLIAIGMVEPSLSVSEVKRWGDAAPASELELVSRRIAQLSGMLPDSAKEAVKEFEANPDAEFRVLPGAEAGDDGGPAAVGDAGR
ncbi:hypothetical protein F8280_12120 [Micromonospora noduli]|uniref:hypothetical protein n=1 Tax=Micromonospora noduli TaxID=709876 RepID=UPI00124B9A10|nr:hypothetical protein [Micromonospora noduli]KAB1925149.1 hypothetical protein F8280_12120 [Micromonospora noduli]